MNVLGGARNFVIEVREELKKCAWPTRNELYDSTLVVIVSVALLALFIAVSDALLSQVMALVIR